MDKYRIKIHGNCLLPIGIEDDSELNATLLTEWKQDINALSQFVGSVVAVKFREAAAIYANGKAFGYIKVLRAVDTLHKTIYLQQLNPSKIYSYPVQWVKDILLVETEADKATIAELCHKK